MFLRRRDFRFRLLLQEYEEFHILEGEVKHQHQHHQQGASKMKTLPEPLFVTTREAAYREAEELSILGFAVEIVVDGNVYIVNPVEDFKCSQQSLPLSSH